MHHHSTMRVAFTCHKCKQWLTETEHYFFYNICSDCKYHDDKQDALN